MRLGTISLIATLLVASSPGGPLRAQEAAQEAKVRQLQEAFQKGPITLQARVLRQVDGQEQELPLFQVPILQAGDRLQMAFLGEAFDRRVTSADWSVVVVFLPRTVAPTENGVVDGRLERDPSGRMVLKELVAPYDAAPLIFLVPDKGGRKKILTDLNSHLEAFRAICLKITDLSEARLHADRFLKGLEALDRNQNPAEYDASVLNFLNLYGDWVSKDLQLLLNKNGSSNLEKYQLLAQEFRRAAVLVPAMQADQIVKVELPQVVPTSPASAYVAIAFDLAKMVQNLWPGHKFRYTPALARDFRGIEADLYYGEWIRTTGTPRGALVCSPCRWEDATPPAFELNLGSDTSLMAPESLLPIQVTSKGLGPFAPYGHDWKLVFQDPALPPLDLKPSPGRQGFVVQPGPALDLLRQRRTRSIQARIQGRWGHQRVASGPATFALDVDPAWQPQAAELRAFQVGGTPTLRLPAAWAATVSRARWRPRTPDQPPLEATLAWTPDGSRTLAFATRGVPAGEGDLELFVPRLMAPALTRPLRLLDELPAITALALHQGETVLEVEGSSLQNVADLRVGDTRFHLQEGVWRSEAPAPQKAGAAPTASATLLDGRTIALPTPRILPPRPQLRDPEVLPLPAGQNPLPLQAAFPMASTERPFQVALQAAPGTRFPLGPTPQVQLRQVEDPADVRTLPATQVRAIGHGQRLLVQFVPARILPAKAAGRLEIRVHLDKLGASAWKPLPLTFLELPDLAAWKQEGTQRWLLGQGLELIEGLSPQAEGPFQRATPVFLEGQPALPVPAPGPDGRLHLRLFGWSDLDLWVQGPAPEAPAPEALAPDTPRVAPPRIEPPRVDPPQVDPPKMGGPGLVPPTAPKVPPPATVPPPRLGGGTA